MAATTTLPPLAPEASRPIAPTGRLALDGAFWRRAAWRGATRAPLWFVRWSPPVIGAAIALGAPDLRRRISEQLAHARGSVGWLRNGRDVLETFANFASCLTEVLARGSKNAPAIEANVHCAPRASEVLSEPGGVILATAHTAGWEIMGALLAREHRRRVMIVMRGERDTGARALQDALRQLPGGVQILHVGGDPLASLPLVRHLREGGVVALQVDRVPAGMTGRRVRLFGRDAAIPEGPLRLAQLTGAPIVPVFSAREGHGKYGVYVREPIQVGRRAEPKALGAAAQQIADALGEFVGAHPTQWFPFHD